LDDATDEGIQKEFWDLVPLEIWVKKYNQLEKEDKFSWKEFILWAMVEYKKLSKWDNWWLSVQGYVWKLHQ
jgi:magnesium chelatase subunit I